MAALAALAGGCAKVYISDVSAEKLAIAVGYDGIVPVNIRNESLASVGSERDADGRAWRGKVGNRFSLSRVR